MTNLESDTQVTDHYDALLRASAKLKTDARSDRRLQLANPHILAEGGPDTELRFFDPREPIGDSKCQCAEADHTARIVSVRPGPIGRLLFAEVRFPLRNQFINDLPRELNPYAKLTETEVQRNKAGCRLAYALRGTPGIEAVVFKTFTVQVEMTSLVGDDQAGTAAINGLKSALRFAGCKQLTFTSDTSAGNGNTGQYL